jgi:tubulin monoglycylase TTLL3/8
MVDMDLNVWLIEVNMSPSMEYSTPITERLVKQVLADITRVVIDGQNGQDTDLDGEGKIGGFNLVFNQ